MSKRSHHRHNGININELAEALTQRGWQPPQQNQPMQGANPMMAGANPMGGNNGLGDNLSALSSLLGAVNGGNMPQGNRMPPMQGAMQQMPGMMPQMPGNMPMMNQQRPSPHPNESDLLKALFQQTIRTLRNE